MRTLVVDDDPFALKVLGRQLANLGVSGCVLREVAQEALAELEDSGQTFELIFVDLQMPEMDGVEFVRHLARFGYAGQLVLVSGEDERILQAAERLAHAHKLNVAGALRKPVSIQELSAVLKPTLARGAAAQRVVRARDPDDLRRAITNGELVNHYQPKVALATGVVVGVESLVRWQHPYDGVIYPDQFIAVAERHDLIDDLTRTVLAVAARQAGNWRAAGTDLHVAVNVSMENLHALDFPEWLLGVAAGAGISPTQLTLEVTESRLMKDPLAVLDILTRLRLKRVDLSIDDFGTGHSSLAQLRDLPFGELKVDRGFVHGAWRDASLRAIVEASLRMARELGMKTVAEGVEDRADWDFLRAAGCNAAQGYFIARPMAADALAGWMAQWAQRRGELVETKG
ncbi:MAG: EAL domain-containing response regulator [Burkholderiales bacterium]|nr:EAL domain-containing response regulator [Burkholderiales bacterium]